MDVIVTDTRASHMDVNVTDTRANHVQVCLQSPQCPVRLRKVVVSWASSSLRMGSRSACDSLLGSLPLPYGAEVCLG